MRISWLRRVKKCFMLFLAQVAGLDVPAAARGGEEHVLERRIRAAEGAEAVGLRAERAEERLAEFAIVFGGKRQPAEAVAIGIARGADLQRRVDRGEQERQRRGVAGLFEPIRGTAEPLAAQVGGRALRDDAALVDDEHAVAGHLDFRWDM